MAPEEGDGMFERERYERRRAGLVSRVGGLILMPGNGESPRNFGDNAYPFRQDSTFLYYFGLARPDVVALIDADSGAATLFGDDPTVAQLVWTAPVPPLAEEAERAGVGATRPRSALAEAVSVAKAAGRPVHWLPPYRGEHVLLLAELLGMDPAAVGAGASDVLVGAVVDQRSRKDVGEVREIEAAVEASVEMHEAAIRLAAPGVTEAEVAAEVERVAQSAAAGLAFPVIATIHGEVLHNHDRTHRLSAGDLFLLDAGAESALGYAGDLTTTWPVAGEPDGRHRDLYGVLAAAYDAAVQAVGPGVPNREVHFAAALAIFDGLKGLGLMRGDAEDGVAAGAHALVFPHGIGHMMGLDVHDMENLGEDRVGYGPEQRRSDQFGLRSLRLARPLEPGFVITVEPGIYFIPRLIDDWRARGHCAAFIDYERLEAWRDCGGMRNEENYLITDDGARRLGPRKPQTMEEIADLRPA